METNRVEKGMKEWLSHEQRLQELFGPEITKQRHFEQCRHDHFRNLYRQIKQDANAEEKVMLKILSGELRRLEKVLYPSMLTRLGRSIYRNVQLLIKKRPESESSSILVIQRKTFSDKPVKVESVNKVQNNLKAVKLNDRSAKLLQKKRVGKSKRLSVR